MEKSEIYKILKKNSSLRSEIIKELLSNIIKGPFFDKNFLSKKDSFLHINNSDFIEDDISFKNIKSSKVIKSISDLKNNLSEKYKLIFCDTPFGNAVKISPLEVFEHLSEDGISVHLMPGFTSTFKSLKGKKFLKKLKEKKIKVLSVLQMPNFFLFPKSGIRSTLVFFSRENEIKPTLFAKYEDENLTSKKLANFQNNMIGYGIYRLLNKEERREYLDANENFLDHLGEIKSSDDNLFDGIERNIDTFESFEFWVQKKSVENLDTEFKEYKFVKLREVSTINITKDNFEENENAIYVPSIGRTEIMQSLPDQNSKKKPHNYFQVIPKDEILTKDYLFFYLESTLGQEALKLEFEKYSDQTIQKIRKEDILNLRIPLPSKKIQLQIIENYFKLKETQDALSTIKENLSLNPLSSSSQISKLNKIYASTLELTAPEIVFNEIKLGESKKREFKQTFNIDIQTNKQEDHIKIACIKTIAGFLNVDGGTLFIGVDDNSDIVGLEKEVGKNKVWKNIDKYVLGVKNSLKSKLGLDAVQLCDFQTFQVKGKEILKINCKRSNKPVYLNKEIYLRVGPSTEKLDTPDIVSWTLERFKETP